MAEQDIEMGSLQPGSLFFDRMSHDPNHPLQVVSGELRIFRKRGSKRRGGQHFPLNGILKGELLYFELVEEEPLHSLHKKIYRKQSTQAYPRYRR